MSPAFVGVPSKIHQREGYGIKIISIEPGLSLLKEEYNSGKILRLDDVTHSLLIEFTKEGEAFVEAIKHSLRQSIAEAKRD
jgi:hypothetical protein